MYYVSLKQFEGPLDLLLHLITKAKVDIKDIFVSEITEQYLASMGKMCIRDSWWTAGTAFAII